jgi:hypothetical protein
MSPSDRGAAVTWSAYTADRPTGEPIKVVTSHDFADLEDVERKAPGVERRYELFSALPTFAARKRNRGGQSLEGTALAGVHGSKGAGIDGPRNEGTWRVAELRANA